jgi:Flp pilus assembly protein TadG
MSTRIDAFRYDRSGTAAVEFAILSPIFLMLLMGMVAYGIYFGASHSLQQIAADAARTAVAGLNEAERQQLASRFVTLNAPGYAFIDPSKLVVQTNDSTADGSQFVVELQYDAKDLPIWALMSKLPLPMTTIVKHSTIRVGGI